MAQHRQQKGLSAENAAKKIQLNPRYIKDLEKNNYQALPADIYTINMLKNYAELLDLNPNTVIDFFYKEKKTYHQTRLKKKDSKPSWQKRFLNVFLNPKILKYLAVSICIILIIGYLGWEVNKIISPPRLVLFSPPKNFITDKNRVEINGKTEKEVNLTINERPLLSDQNGNFSLNLDLQKGLNIIKISAQKKHSKDQTVYRQVIVKSSTKTN